GLDLGQPDHERAARQRGTDDREPQRAHRGLRVVVARDSAPPLSSVTTKSTTETASATRPAAIATSVASARPAASSRRPATGPAPGAFHIAARLSLRSSARPPVTAAEISP